MPSYIKDDEASPFFISRKTEKKRRDALKQE